ncbi:secondary thiamine-phosphate synthase enzyme [Catalinimonas alkaloidigena]|uniref:Secondary thiamine-phosphate synthase enzyme n=1 Tax=Catalinimonas alkaloidigena TaxID=1075417 RepID=A0A1G9AHC0_9BACT|nr:secondary thiamine-phosphate synthase enzyme YjbQ [Catalinimonas alkaloidigena]SDK26214.1 secondary thiamine-phosphate synthase enzyme [Catalinimonas alkaloidigena]
MAYFQKTITLPPHPRGFHLITRHIEREIPELRDFQVGIAHIFIQHTSASLSLNENADPTVRADFESHFNKMVPENAPYYEHTLEGPDDMPAHIKAALLGSAVTVPVSGGQFNLGTWQGVYLCEHRNHGGRRRLVVTLMGEPR